MFIFTIALSDTFASTTIGFGVMFIITPYTYDNYYILPQHA